LEQIELLKLLALPLSIVFLGLWLSSAINKLANALNHSPTDNYEIALRITKEIHSSTVGLSPSEKQKVEKEIFETYQKALQMAENIDYETKEKNSA